MLATFLHVERDEGCFTKSEVSDYCWFLRKKMWTHISSINFDRWDIKNRHLQSSAVGWCRRVCYAERRPRKLTTAEERKVKSSVTNKKKKCQSQIWLPSTHLNNYVYQEISVHFFWHFSQYVDKININWRYTSLGLIILGL